VPIADASLERLRDEVREFLAHERATGGFSPRVNAWMDAHDPEFSERLGARGWIGMTWPEQYGGGARSALERYVVTEELLAAGAPVAAHWFADRQVGPQLLRFGTEAQRARFLPAIAAGRCFFAIGMSEPESGSDLANIRTAAEAVEPGWRVRGTKTWTSHAHRDDFMIALCRTTPRGEDRHDGLSQLIVDLRSDGVTVSPIIGLDGAAHFSEVTLQDVLVPAENLVGAEGDGWTQVTSELAFERSGPERFLSVIPLLEAALNAMGVKRSRADDERAGRAFAQLMSIRRLSLGVVSALQRGAPEDVGAALVKDLGTRCEQELVEALRLVFDDGAQPPGYAGLLADSVLAAPGFTLRGGTTEILRGIVGRALVASP
jgi:alkylation response protein AidB-like acyl-CoA dehydrogenase